MCKNLTIAHLYLLLIIIVKYLLYKDEKPPSIGTFSPCTRRSVVSTWIDARFAQNEAPVFRDHEVHFKKVLIAVVCRLHCGIIRIRSLHF